MPRSAVLLLFVLLSGCSTSTRAVVRLDTGQGEPIVHTPRRDVEPVAVSEKEFKKAVAQHAPAVPPVERPLEHARQLFGLPERSGWYRYEGRSQRLSGGSSPRRNSQGHSEFCSRKQASRLRSSMSPQLREE